MSKTNAKINISEFTINTLKTIVNWDDTHTEILNDILVMLTPTKFKKITEMTEIEQKQNDVLTEAFQLATKHNVCKEQKQIITKKARKVNTL